MPIIERPTLEYQQKRPVVPEELVLADIAPSSDERHNEAQSRPLRHHTALWTVIDSPLWARGSSDLNHALDNDQMWALADERMQRLIPLASQRLAFAQKPGQRDDGLRRVIPGIRQGSTFEEVPSPVPSR
jgi:hypothetical protein